MCTTCSDNICSCGGITIPTGQNGADGADGTNGENGLFGGYSSDWLYDATSILSNPAARYFRFNNVLPTGATEIYINKFNWGNDNIEPFLTEFNNSGNFGKIRVFKEFDSNVYFWYNITGFSQAGNVTTLSVTFISGNGTLVTDDQCVISFTPGSVQYSASTVEVTAVDNPAITAGQVFFATGAIVPSSGKYKVTFVSDYTLSGALIYSFNYRFIVNGTQVGTTKTESGTSGGAGSLTIAHQGLFTLVAGHEVNVINLINTTHPKTRSIIIERVS